MGKVDLVYSNAAVTLSAWMLLTAFWEMQAITGAGSGKQLAGRRSQRVNYDTTSQINSWNAMSIAD